MLAAALSLPAAASAQATIGYGALTGVSTGAASGVAASGRGAVDVLRRAADTGSGGVAPDRRRRRRCVRGCRDGAPNRRHRRPQPMGASGAAELATSHEPSSGAPRSPADAASIDAASPATAEPPRLRERAAPTRIERGWTLARLRELFGRPEVAVLNLDGQGYDAKYVFESADGARYTVLTRGGVVWDAIGKP